MDIPDNTYSGLPLGRLLSLTGRIYLHALNQRLASLDIHRNYLALLHISEAEGRITQQELACMLETDKVSMVRNIDYLSAKGYVERTRNPEDRRKYSLTLTPKARKALPEIRDSFWQLNHLAFGGLSESEKESFYRMLQIIKNNLQNNTSEP